MTSEKTKDLLERGVLQAHSERKTIQYRGPDGWHDIKVPDVSFDGDSDRYRIKPEPREFWIAIDANKRVYDQPVTSDGAEIIHVREVTNE